MAHVHKILIIGAGITGAISANALRKYGCKIHVWDKAKGAGGRMSTSRSPSDSKCTADLGAQYLSTTPQAFQLHQRYYQDLLAAGVINPLQSSIEGDKSPAGTKHFVTPQGINSLVKHYLSSSGAALKFEQRVKQLKVTGNQWTVTTETGSCEVFDAVILTMPAPQILDLQGDISSLLGSQFDVKQKLSEVSYSSRYAVALFFPIGTTLPYDWAAKYIDDPCIRFVSVDNKKRNVELPDVGPALVAHTSVDFGVEYLEGNVDAVCSNMVLPRLRTVLPDLPQPDRVKNQKWRYSQVHRPYADSPGALLLTANPPLVCAGDGFTKSGFDGCIDSAEKAVDLLRQCIKQ